MEKKDKKEKKEKKEREITSNCCYVVDPCGCYTYTFDPCRCAYVDPCCC
ncbi:MAG TPA: hypothetical protein QF571_09105 [Desulfobacterales bacterium]|nr:hypothetical protein [Desulfobacterales bacterium]